MAPLFYSYFPARECELIEDPDSSTQRAYVHHYWSKHGAKTGHKIGKTCITKNFNLKYTIIYGIKDFYTQIYDVHSIK